MNQKLLIRIITALVLLAIVIPVISFGGIAVEILGCIIGVLCVKELLNMAKKPVLSIEGILSSIAVIAMIWPFWQNFGPLATLTGASVFYFALLGIFAFTVVASDEFNVIHAGFLTLIVYYVGTGLSAMVASRAEYPIIIVFGIVVAVATDTGAFFAGSILGKTFPAKMAPKISPNKTIVGAIGGIILALVVVLIMNIFIQPVYAFNRDLIQLIIYVVILSFVGQFGDLFESGMKRYFKVKDSSNLLPGHGGVLDRMDSLLFIFPLMHIFNLF
ncbi:MAG: phosphatidate cytidylyltransferase [Lactobacillales bacterium]|jgi:phosphatidate cytidylyltransferase|nr:phosphatidate cytidylyltransferase [Lactobacillales bacterium]